MRVDYYQVYDCTTQKMSKKLFEAICSNWTNDGQSEILNNNIEVVHGVDEKGNFEIEIYLYYDKMLKAKYDK